MDVVAQRVADINARRCPLADKELADYMANRPLDLRATTDAAAAYTGADWVIISTPTNYDENKNYFDTSSVEDVLALVGRYAPQATVVIKSTVPVGYTAAARERFGNPNLLFSPEFLREGHALYDNLYPAASWWARRRATNAWPPKRANLPRCCSRAPASRISPRCSPA